MEFPLCKSCELRAFAKLNLTLEITGKRGDGYHLLRMVTQSVGLFDRVALSIDAGEFHGGEIRLLCAEPAIDPMHNTALLAAEAFFRATEIPNHGLEIRIEKRIPTAAGMAGGSADAAAVLLGLNHMFGGPLSEEELSGLGLGIGADVPFCLRGSTMLVEGVGEILTPLSPIPECFFVIAKPEDGMSTAESYRLYDLLAPPPAARPDDAGMLAAIADGSLRGIAANLHNALEAAAPPEQIAEIKRALLENGALGASMTGSGTAVFGLFDCEDTARRACRTLAARYRQIYLTGPARRGVEIAE